MSVCSVWSTATCRTPKTVLSRKSSISGDGLRRHLTWLSRCQVYTIASVNYDCLSEQERSSAPGDRKYHTLNIGGLNQVMAHAVVTSFIHRNTFTKENHLLLVILMNSVKVAVAFYNLVFDVLFHVLPIRWRDRHRLWKSSICFLWMVLHHELFPQTLAEVWKEKKAGNEFCRS